MHQNLTIQSSCGLLITTGLSSLLNIYIYILQGKSSAEKVPLLRLIRQYSLADRAHNMLFLARSDG